MEIDFPVVSPRSEGLNDTEMSFESFSDQLKDFNLFQISPAFDSLYQNYCSYILFETIRLFPLFKFEFPLDLTKIFINYDTRPKPIQQILREEKEVLRVKRKPRKAYSPIKKMKIIEEISEFDNFMDISPYSYCNLVSPLDFIRYQECLNWNKPQSNLIVF